VALRNVSFEYFPPNTPQGLDKLCATHRRLETLEPEYVSVTYGAGGSTREKTRDVVLRLAETGRTEVAPHLSFGADGEQTIGTLLDQYREAGVRRVVALRGDMPSGIGGGRQLVHARDLVAFIRARYGDHFDVSVACYPEMHPQALSFGHDVDFLRDKLEAGAQRAITQYFFSADAYFFFRDFCISRGISQPLYPGIMPIHNFASLQRFSSNCGAEIPRWIRQRMEDFGDDAQAARDFGVEVVTRLCTTLLDGGAPGLHFYTLNQAELTERICRNLQGA
jgi:methylenetetrahydrofolate reductase (NADPH)